MTDVRITPAECGGRLTECECGWVRFNASDKQVADHKVKCAKGVGK